MKISVYYHVERDFLYWLVDSLMRVTEDTHNLLEIEDCGKLPGSVFIGYL